MTAQDHSQDFAGFIVWTCSEVPTRACHSTPGQNPGRVLQSYSKVIEDDNALPLLTPHSSNPSSTAATRSPSFGALASCFLHNPAKK